MDGITAFRRMQTFDSALQAPITGLSLPRHANLMQPLYERVDRASFVRFVLCFEGQRLRLSRKHHNIPHHYDNLLQHRS